VVSGNWYEVTHLNSGPSRIISIQNIECEALVSSNWGWNIQPFEYFYLFLFPPGFVGPHPEGNNTEWKRKENSKHGT
jgi:hypothetical protein